MKKILVIFVAVLLSACSSQNKKEVSRLDSGISDLRNYQAEQTTQISALQSQLHRLQGRVEELEYLLKKRGQMAAPSADSMAPNAGASQGYGQQAEAPRPKPVPPSVVPLSALEDDETFARSLPANPSRNFSQALLRIREGNFRESLTLLQQMIQAGERSEWLPNVLFWLGVTYEGLGEEKNALRAYNDVVVQFPRHKRVPLALYRQAGALKAMGDSKSSALFLKKIITDYPDSPEAARARDELKSRS